MLQLVQVLGSLLILAAFAAHQRGIVAQTSRTYLLLNLAGSVVLAVLAAHERQLGFLLLETCWALVSALGLRRRVSRAEPALPDARPPERRMTGRVRGISEPRPPGVDHARGGHERTRDDHSGR